MVLGGKTRIPKYVYFPREVERERWGRGMMNATYNREGKQKAIISNTPNNKCSTYNTYGIHHGLRRYSSYSNRARSQKKFSYFSQDTKRKTQTK